MCNWDMGISNGMILSYCDSYIYTNLTNHVISLSFTNFSGQVIQYLFNLFYLLYFLVRNFECRPFEIGAPQPAPSGCIKMVNFTV